MVPGPGTENGSWTRHLWTRHLDPGTNPGMAETNRSGGQASENDAYFAGC